MFKGLSEHESTQIDTDFYISKTSKKTKTAKRFETKTGKTPSNSISLYRLLQLYKLQAHCDRAPMSSYFVTCTCLRQVILLKGKNIGYE